MSKKNEQTIRTAIAMKLIEYRHTNGLAQRQMAQKVGMERSHYAKCEAGSATPRPSILVRICTLLNCSIQQLCDELAHS